MADFTEMMQRIEERKKQLVIIGEELKKQFFGIDEPIDKLLFNIEAWWCLPELMTRPTIVCLWGLTGVGKTDLIRKLVQYLNMADSFVEIQMTNKGSASHQYENSLQSLLNGSNISEEESGVLLLDEMQRFRSVDSVGKDIDDYRFQDLWMLLSDGSFSTSSNNKDSLEQMIWDEAYNDDYNVARDLVDQSRMKDKEKEEDDDGNHYGYFERMRDIEEKRKYKRSYSSARRMKSQFRLSEEIGEVMQWDGEKKLEILYEKLEDKSIFKPVSYPKLLVLIAGNLDEAYQMSNATNETDIDADLFHKHSQRISLIKIKSSLRSRFKPEQIARFGNSHIIYPSLSRGSYEEIIRRKVEGILESCHKATGVKFKVDQTVLDAIYRNGVFPAQGTRPVFSTISCFFECTIPQFVYRCVKENITEAVLYYNNKHLCCDLTADTFKVKNEGDIDRIKSKKRNEDKIVKTAVHEAGHALIYAKLFGVMPTQVSVNLASDDANGFIGLHEIECTKQMILDKITCLMAGRGAEELVFTVNNIGAGASGDIAAATASAAAYIRKYGMGEYLSRLELPSNGVGDAGFCNNDIDSSNNVIESLLKDQKERAMGILKDHQELLMALSDYLVLNDTYKKEDFIETCSEYGLEVDYLDAKETVLPPFRKAYQEFSEGLERAAENNI